jgi:hypothetical protein
VGHRRRPSFGAVARRRLATALFLGALTAGCQGSDSDYFGTYDSTWVAVPTVAGDPVYVGVTLLNAHPGDTVEIDSVTFGDVTGDAIAEPLAAILRGETHLLGGMRASEIGESVDLTPYASPVGLRFAAHDGPVALAARLSGTAPVLGFRYVVVRFRANDGPIHVDQIDFRASVCIGATFEEAVERCRPIEDEMDSFRP